MSEHRSESRQFERYAVRHHAKIVQSDDRSSGSGHDVRLEDIGRTGVRFYSSEALAVDSTWRLIFVYRNTEVGSVALQVRHSQSLTDGGHAVGAQFVIEPALFAILNDSLDELTPELSFRVDPFLVADQAISSEGGDSGVPI